MDLKYLNVTIERYDLDLIRSNANAILGSKPGYTSSMAWTEAVMDYLFQNKLLNLEVKNDKAE